MSATVCDMDEITSVSEVGAILHRPTGTELLAWQLYAAALEKAERLEKENRKLRRLQSIE